MKWVTIRDLLYSTRNSVQCYVAPGWEGHLGENGYLYMHGWVPWLFTWNCHNIVNRLCMRAQSLQSCPTLCDPVDCSPPGSSIHGILQARILEWIAFSFSKGSSQPGDWTLVSCISCIADGFFTTEPPRKLPNWLCPNIKCKSSFKKVYIWNSEIHFTLEDIILGSLASIPILLKRSILI